MGLIFILIKTEEEEKPELRYSVLLAKVSIYSNTVFCPKAFTRSQADASAMFLDLQNCELSKPPFFINFPASDILL